MKQIDPKKLHIFVISEQGVRKEIDDLYWFEENFIHDLSEGFDKYLGNYRFEVFVDD